MADNNVVFDIQFKTKGADGVAKSIQVVASNLADAQRQMASFVNFSNHALNGMDKHYMKIAKQDFANFTKANKSLSKGTDADFAKALGKNVKLVVQQDDTGKISTKIDSNVHKRASNSSMNAYALLQNYSIKIARDARKTLDTIQASFNSIGQGSSSQFAEIKKAYLSNVKKSFEHLQKIYSGENFGSISAKESYNRYKNGLMSVNGVNVSGMSALKSMGLGSVSGFNTKKEFLRSYTADNYANVQKKINDLANAFSKNGLSLSSVTTAKDSIRSLFAEMIKQSAGGVKNFGMSTGAFKSNVKQLNEVELKNKIESIFSPLKEMLNTKIRADKSALLKDKKDITQGYAKGEALNDVTSKLDIAQKEAYTKLRNMFLKMGLPTSQVDNMQRSTVNGITQMRTHLLTMANDTAISSREFMRRMKLAVTQVNFNGVIESAKNQVATEKKNRDYINRLKIASVNAEQADIKAQEAKRRSAKSQIETLIEKRINDLRTENIHQNKGQRRIAEIFQERYNKLLTETRKEFDSIKQPNVELLNNALHDLFVKTKKAVDEIHVKSAHEMVRKGTTVWGSAQLQSGLAGAGGLTLESGRKFENYLKVLPLDRISNQFTGMMQSVFYASWYNVFSNMSSIIGSLSELAITAIIMPFKTILAAVAGVIKGIGILMMRGVVTAIMSSMNAITGTLGSILTIGLGTFVVIGYSIITIITDLLNTIGTMIKTAMEAIGSIINTAIQVVVLTVKSVFEAVTGIVRGAFEGIKQIVISIVEFSKQMFNSLIEVCKQGLTQFGEINKAATLAFKETIPVMGQSINSYQTLIRKLHSTFGIDLKDVGAGLFDIVSSGFRNITQATELANASAKLSIASTSSMATAVRAVVVAYQNYKDKGESVNSIINTLAKASTLGSMNMEELGSSMKMIMGLSSRAGISFENTMMSLSYLTNIFGRGSIEQATQYFSRFIEAIVMPTSKARQQLVGLGIDFNEMSGGKDVFKDMIALSEKLSKLEFSKVRGLFPTIQSRRAWLALTANIEHFKNTYKSSVEMGGDNITKQFDVVMKSYQQVMAVIKANTNVVFSYVGGLIWNMFGGSIVKVKDAFINLVSAMNSSGIDTFFKELSTWFKPISDKIFEPVMNVFKFLTTQFTKAGKFNWKQFFNSSEMLQIRQEIINFLNNIGTTFTNIMSEATRITVNVVKSIMSSESGNLKALWSFLTTPDYSKWVDFFDNIKRDIVTTFNTVLAIVGNVEKFGDLFRTVWQIFAEYASPVFTMIKGIAIKVFMDIGAAIGLTIYTSILEAIYNVMPMLENAFNSLPLMMRTALGFHKGMFDSAREMIGGQIYGSQSNNNPNKVLPYTSAKEYDAGVYDNLPFRYRQSSTKNLEENKRIIGRGNDAGGYEDALKEARRKYNTSIGKNFGGFGGILYNSNGENSDSVRNAKDRFVNSNAGVDSVLKNKNSLTDYAEKVGRVIVTQTHVDSNGNQRELNPVTYNVPELVKQLTDTAEALKRNPSGDVERKAFADASDAYDRFLSKVVNPVATGNSKYLGSKNKFENVNPNMTPENAKGLMQPASNYRFKDIQKAMIDIGNNAIRDANRDYASQIKIAGERTKELKDVIASLISIEKTKAEEVYDKNHAEEVKEKAEKKRKEEIEVERKKLAGVDKDLEDMDKQLNKDTGINNTNLIPVFKGDDVNSDLSVSEQSLELLQQILTQLKRDKATNIQVEYHHGGNINVSSDSRSGRVSKTINTKQSVVGQ